jgi:peroxiredoxin
MIDHSIPVSHAVHLFYIRMIFFVYLTPILLGFLVATLYPIGAKFASQHRPFLQVAAMAALAPSVMLLGWSVVARGRWTTAPMYGLGYGLGVALLSRVHSIRLWPRIRIETRRAAAARLCLLFLMIAAASAQPVVPRPAPEFQVREPSGRTTMLSSYRGHVVALAFVVTTCPHCQALSSELQKMAEEFGPRGLRVAEVAFDEGGDVPGFVKKLKLTYPVGQCSREQMRGFLQMSWNGRIGTPQVVLIDRTGMIRAQSEPGGSPLLQQADVLRGLIAPLTQTPSSRK